MLETKHLGSPAVFWATGFGTGFIKPAPGTWGSLLAVAIWWFVLSNFSLPVQLAVIVVYLGVSVWLVQRVLDQHDVHDAPEIVADEVVGMWIALFAVPGQPLAVLAGFLLFRLFDIWKPVPIRTLDKSVPGAWGVMLDDIAAGVAAMGVLHLSLWLINN